MLKPDTLFSICSAFAMIGWLLLVVSPLHKNLTKAVQIGVVPILLAMVYLYLIVLYFGDAEGGFGSLEEVMTLFSNKNVVLAGWVHYLAFDLWIGSWQLGDSRKRGINHFVIIPCMFLTFMFGPIGLLLYLIIRTVHAKKVVTDDNF